jgi:hypothetical protein
MGSPPGLELAPYCPSKVKWPLAAPHQPGPRWFLDRRGRLGRPRMPAFGESCRRCGRGLLNHSGRPPSLIGKKRTYCFSHTEMLLIGRPFAFVPVVVKVKLLPSWDMTKVVVCTTLPAFVRLPLRV